MTGTQGSALVDEALRKMDDWAISAEVQFYRTSCSRLDEAHTELAKQRRLVSKLAADAKESVYRLSQANVYQCIEDHLDRIEDPIFWLGNSELREQLGQIRDMPETFIPLYCVWCHSESHDPKDCAVFFQCFYCKRFGHQTHQCYTPHRACRETCIVSPTHIKYHHKCRARPYVEEAPEDRLTRQEERRSRRVERRYNRH